MLSAAHLGGAGKDAVLFPEPGDTALVQLFQQVAAGLIIGLHGMMMYDFQWRDTPFGYTGLSDRLPYADGGGSMLSAGQTALL